MSRIETALPAIDGAMSDATYFVKSSLLDPKTSITKDQMKTAFMNRFGYYPEEIFFGKPNGSLIYAGPVIENSPTLTARGSGNLQQDQLNLFNEV